MSRAVHPSTPLLALAAVQSTSHTTTHRTVLIRYFASVREAMRMDCETCMTKAETLQALRESLRTRGEPWASALSPERPIRMALNHTLAKPETPLPLDGALEVAFFPPVTGG